MANQVIVSYHFGTSSELDAYWVAFAVMSFLAFPLTPMREALVPEVHRHAQISAQAASDYFSKALSLILLVACIGGLIGIIFSNSIFDWFDEKNNPLMRVEGMRNLMWLAPAIILLALSDTLNSLLISYNRVILQSLFRILAAGASVATIALAVGWLGSFVLVLGFIVGQLISVLFLIHALWKEGLRFRFCLPLGLGNNFLHLSGVLFVSYALSQIYSVYEKVTFVDLSTGLVSAFQYAVSITNVVITVIGLSVANVLWPRFLKHSASENYQQMHRELITTLKAVLLLLGGVCVLIYALSSVVVQLLFMRGSFDQAAATLTTQALEWAIFAAIPISIGFVIGKVLLSQGASKSIMAVGLITAVFGMLILFLAKAYGSTVLAMSHWVFANSLGSILAFFLVVGPQNRSISNVLKTLYWLLRLILVACLAIYASDVPVQLFPELPFLPLVVLRASCFILIYGLTSFFLGLLSEFIPKTSVRTM